MKVKNKKETKRKSKYFVYYVLVILISFLLVYGLIAPKLSRERQDEVHRHADLTIEGIDVKSLKHAEDFNIHFPIHLHKGDVIPTLHMEGFPTPLTEFFKSIHFDTSSYEIYSNGESKDFNYIFDDGDKIELKLRKLT